MFNHNEISEYTHDETMKKVIPYITSDVTIVKLEVLDFQVNNTAHSMSKFGIPVGQYFYQEMAMHIDNIVSNTTGHIMAYYGGDRIPSIELWDYTNVPICTFYFVVV
jgi:hypothetical protein